MAKIKNIRFLFEHRQRLLKFCQIGISQSDASIYIFPYARKGIYYSGTRTMGVSEKQLEPYKDRFDYHDQLDGEETPKVSIHQSGQIHIHLGKDRTKELYIPQLNTMQDEHIASITAVSFSKLPVFNREPKLTGIKRDFIISGDPEIESGRLVIYVNGHDNSFSQKGTILTIERKTLHSSLFFCISAVPQPPLDEPPSEKDGSQPGVIVITGWDPRKMNNDQETEYHYLIAE